MDWLELSVETESLGADVVSELLIRHGAKGTQIIDRADVPDPAEPGNRWVLVDASLRDGMPKAVVVKAWLRTDSDLTPLREALQSLPAVTGMDLGSLRLSISSVRDEQWAEYWKRFYKPFRLGERLVVRPSWERYDARPGDLVIHLDPGMAFGTGTHESTSLCARLMEKHCQGGRVLDGHRQRHPGHRRGAAGRRRGAGRRYRRHGGAHRPGERGEERPGGQGPRGGGRPGEGRGGRFRMAVANILADVIISLAGPLQANLLPGAVFICSGIIRERAQDVLDALQPIGYRLLSDSRQGEWVALAFRAPE